LLLLVLHLYAEYKKIKEEMKDFLIAKRNIDMYLGKNDEENFKDQTKEKEKRTER